MWSFSIEKPIAWLDCALNIEYSKCDWNDWKTHNYIYMGHFTLVALKIETLELELWKWNKITIKI
jgi:hypothetical protein